MTEYEHIADFDSLDLSKGLPCDATAQALWPYQEMAEPASHTPNGNPFLTVRVLGVLIDETRFPGANEEILNRTLALFWYLFTNQFYPTNPPPGWEPAPTKPGMVLVLVWRIKPEVKHWPETQRFAIRARACLEWRDEKSVTP